MSTSTPTRPQPTFRPPEPDHERPRFLGLSLTQLIATAFAGITATVAGSYLGVSGTVVGAGLASVLTAIGNAVYGASIRRTRDTVRAVVPVPARRPTSGAGARRAVRHPRATAASREAAPAHPSPRRRPRPGRGVEARPRRSMPWRGVALGSIGMFVAVLAGVTVTEALAGRPLTDLVRGDSGSGTSLFGGTTNRGTSPSVTPPTITQTVTQQVVQQTETKQAPTATVTRTPTTTVTGTPTATPSDSGSASQSVSQSPSATTTPLP